MSHTVWVVPEDDPDDPGILEITAYETQEAADEHWAAVRARHGYDYAVSYVYIENLVVRKRFK